MKSVDIENLRESIDSAKRIYREIDALRASAKSLQHQCPEEAAEMLLKADDMENILRKIFLRMSTSPALH